MKFQFNYSTIYISLIIYLFSSKILFSQQFKIDSLLQIQKTMKDDTIKAKIILKIAELCEMSAQENMEFYGNQALTLSEKLNYKKGIVEASIWLSQSNWYQSRYEQTISFAQKALDVNEQVKSKLYESSALSLMAWGYWSKLNSEKALYYFYKALEIPENESNKKYLIRTYMGLGQIMRSVIRDEKKGNMFREKCYDLAIKYNDKQEIAHALSGKANKLQQKGKLLDALKVNFNALEFSKQIGDKYGMLNALPSIARLYGDLGDSDKELEFYLQSLKIYQEINHLESAALTMTDIGRVYIKKKDYSNSIRFLTKSLVLADSVNSNLVRKEVYQSLAEFFEIKHNYKLAYFYFSKYKIYSDSVQESLDAKKVIELQNIYEQTKQQQIKEFEERKNIDKTKLMNKIYLSGLILSLFIIFLIFRYYREKQIAKIKFVAYDIEQKERARIAKDIHDDLGSGLSKITLMAEYAKQNIHESKKLNETILSISKTSRKLIESMRDLVWALNSENLTIDVLFAQIHEYCSEYLEEFPVESKFDISLKFPELKLTKEAQRNIFLIIKEAVNNSLKYSSASKIQVKVKNIEKALHIEVSDNGKGFNIQNNTYNGNGILNMKHRTEIIGGQIEINSVLGKGTQVKCYFSLSKITYNFTT